MRINKRNLLISVVVILFILLLFLPKIIDLIPSVEVKFVVVSILASLTLIFMIIETYQDITKKQFTTTVFIVLSDIIQIVAFLVLGYLSFRSYDVINIEAVLTKNDARMLAIMLIFGANLVRTFLKSQRFEKKLNC
jgi:hypothetical protein